MRLIRADERGVTLIELVVVATLVAILSTVLYGIMSGLLRARDSTEKIRDAETTAHYLFARMTKELSSTSRSLTALSNANGTGNSNNAAAQASQDQAQAQAQTQGQGLTAATTALYFEGINKKEGEFARDSIRFVSSNAAQPFVDGPANYGTVEIRYILRQASDEEAARVSVDTKGRQESMVFVREEVPAATNNQDILKKRKIILPLAGNVLSMNFRYLKDGKWQNEWKELNPPLPEAVEITLGLVESDGEVAYYRTALPMLPRVRSRKATAGAQ